ncbi:MEDS domain-containing protein [Actinomadura macrotermitis]|uniref:STAS domain-containing protein n=1 Tax=Actinomadura macrotermitis TaxID=2585200 RepID=A0A7K0BZV7_9ACTN|nr:MEDS domain-containing protein [Actinomadura macrotermitis]MQY06735.1 hypothetical protein [Actinomadura macrotermitis]
METWYTKRAVSGVRPGDHGILPYSGPEERNRVMSTFMSDALGNNEKVVYVTDTEPERLPGIGPRTKLQLHGYTETRQLVVVRREDACLDSRGRFDPDKLVQTLRTELARTDDEGYRAMRWTTDNSWLLHGRIDLSQVIGCEHQIAGAVGPSTMVMAVCQVDRRRCPPDRYAALQDTHEVLIEDDPRFDDGTLKIVQTYAPPGLRIEGELDHARQTRFAEELAQICLLPGPVHIDMSRLGFLDLGGLNLLVQYAADRPGGDPVVLDDLPPNVASTIDLIGWHRMPGLIRGRDRRAGGEVI